MPSLRDWILPYRLLLRYSKQAEIAGHEASFLPAPYDLVVVQAQERARASSDGVFGLNDSTVGQATIGVRLRDSRLPRWVVDDRVAYGALTVEAAALYGADAATEFLKVDDAIYEAYHALPVSNLRRSVTSVRASTATPRISSVA
jgi:hypothetical protein